MAAQVIGYEFSYDTPTVVDGVNVDVPTTFSLSGVTQDVAKGIRQGLRNVPSIKNVVAAQVTQDRGAVPQ
jgi:hypothetical protein